MKKLLFTAALATIVLVGCGESKEYPTMTELAAEKEIDYATLNEENVSKAVIEVLGDKNDEDKDRVINVEINDKNYMTVNVNADKSLDASYILKDANELFAELKKFESAEQLNVFWYGTAVLEDGTEKDIEIVKTGFVRKTIDKIDFKDFPIEDYETYSLPYFVHPAWEF